jgi:protein-tyrosine phosphatase
MLNGAPLPARFDAPIFPENTMPHRTERHIPLQGSVNFRDIGGYETADGRTVRWQRLYRSDGLSQLTEEDLAVLAPIGVASIFDLRSHHELEHHGPATLVATQGARHHHLPFLRGNLSAVGKTELPPLAQLYEEMVEHGSATIRSLFELLTDDATYPAVVHCTVGKDRTGVAVALVLRTLGVDDATIATDFSLTEKAIDRIAAKLEANRAADAAPIRQDLLSSDAAIMIGFLQVIDARFGGTEQVLRDSGVPIGAREQLRALLLES